MEEVLFSAMLAEGLEGRIMLLDFFGQKTNGGTYGTAFAFMAKVHQDPDAKNALSGLLGDLGRRFENMPEEDK